MNPQGIRGWTVTAEREETDPILTFTTTYGMAFEVELYEGVVALGLLSPCCIEILDVFVEFSEDGQDGPATLICTACDEFQSYSSWGLRGAWNSGERLPEFFLAAIEAHCDPLQAAWEQGTAAVLLEKLQLLFKQFGPGAFEAPFLLEMDETLTKDGD